MNRFALIATVVIGMVGSTAVYADNDRAPTAEERNVEEALKAAGFTAWEGIELENGTRWEVDDAVHTDGKTYDVDFDADYKITKKELED